MVGAVIVAGLVWAVTGSHSEKGWWGDKALERASWVGAIAATLAIVVAVVRWAWLWNADRPLRELAGPDGFLGDAPRPGRRFVKRPDLSGRAVAALRRRPRRGHRAPVVALVGFGGAGKSTLAAAVSRTWRLRRRYKTAVWLKAEPGTDPLALLTRFARLLGVVEPAYASVDEARDSLKALLRRRRLLIVLDNVWTRAPLDAVLDLGSGCPVLFTTRSNDLALTSDATVVEIDELTQTQALDILAVWTNQRAAELPQGAYRLCTRLQNLALGVAMAGAMACRGRSYDDILTLIDQDLQQVKGDFTPQYEHPSLRAAIDIGIDDLPPADRNRYLQLAVFTGRGPFTATAAAALWHPHTDLQTKALLTDLIGRSLLTPVGAGGDGGGWYVAHDLHYDTCIQRLGPEQVRAAHTALLTGYQVRGSGDWTDIAASDLYLPGNLAWHLTQAGHCEDLVRLLSRLSWMLLRITTASLPDLISDYTHTAHPRAIAIRRALMKSAPALTRPSTGLAGLLTGQLVGRLVEHPDPEVAAWAATLQPPEPTWRLESLTPGVLIPAEHPLELILTGHSDAVTSVAFSPDGARALTAGLDGTARMWDTATGRELFRLTGHSGRVMSVAFSPDGGRVLTAGFDGPARIWDAVTGRELLTGPFGSAVSAAFSPDGGRALTGGGVGARIWDTATGRELLRLTGHTRQVLSVAFSPDGGRVLTAGFGGPVRMWDAATGRELFQLTGHHRSVGSVAFSPDGSRALTGGDDGTARVWDSATGREILQLTGPTRHVSAVAFSPDGDRVLTGDSDGTARVWDAATGRELLRLTGHTRPVVSVAFSPDGARALTGGGDGTARIWDTANGLAEPPPRSTALLPGPSALSSDGTRVLTGDSDGTARVWDAATGRELLQFTGHFGSVVSVALSPDGGRALVGGAIGPARMWDTSTGRVLYQLPGAARRVYAVAFSPDGDRVLIGDHDGPARLWDTATGRELLRLNGPTRQVYAVAFSPDGDRVLTGDSDGTARVWDAATGRELLQLTSHTGQVSAVAFSPDGDRVLTGDSDGTARVWDTATGRQLLRLTGPTTSVVSVAYSPDGDRILTGNSDSMVRVWDVADGCELALWRSDRRVSECRFAPDDSAKVIVVDGEAHQLQLMPPI
ncbi:NB-ARC domain-containing protein [Actinomadura sp. NPDC049753]|uniref:NB-ARC domain-containing protein n=1 Tax=Actinomadura sp. NPDC049753 TaxID=3154739 RepID=UPI003428BDD7